jgi:hypothetical protein
MPRRSIGSSHDTPEQAALNEGLTIVKIYAAGTVIARKGTIGYRITRNDSVPESIPVLMPLNEETPQAIGNYEDTPREAASHAGLRVVKIDSFSIHNPAKADEDVIAIDTLGMIYSIEKTANGPFSMFLGFVDDPAMSEWLE